jgi:squalene-hopene/tetraprenyl-beta-curcumene cyclase
MTESAALRKLAAIQPASGGFLEATPLTSFVAMSLCGAELADHPVTQKCLDFIVRSARHDGSWPIDTNLATWLTTNAVLALDAAGALSEVDTKLTAAWLAGQQHRTVHPYTRAAPGAWAWTPLDGGVPDADDTARAALALQLLRSHEPARAGLDWLLDLQNRDGGWPTFCRGWGKLPFDKSAPDLTAHAIEALNAAPPSARIRRAIGRGLDYLRRTQRDDGAWLPLWFGNQFAPDKSNPVFGTAAVLPALFALHEADCSERGVAYLVGSQNEDGGWGGARGLRSTVEETATAASALAQAPARADARAALRRAASWLLDKLDDGTWLTPSPIGLYFSSLWYSERLYPIIWVTEAFGRMGRATELTDD